MQVNYAFSGKSSFYSYAILHRKFNQFSIVVQTLIRMKLLSFFLSLLLLSAENVETIFEIQKKCTKTKGYPGVFAYDFFESEKYYGCGAGFN